MAKKKKTERGLLTGFTNLLKTLDELAETGKVIQKEVKKGGTGVERKVSVRHIVPPGKPRPRKRKERLKPGPKLEKVKAEPQEKESLVDIFDHEDHIAVVASLPGVSEENLDFEVLEEGLRVSAGTPEGKVEKDISIPKEARVYKIIGASFKHGTLEVRLRKKKEKSE